MLDNLYIYDFEIYAHDWVVSFKNHKNGKCETYHNANEGVKDFIKTHDPLLVGYNNKHYDKYMLRGVLNDKTPEELKEINDYIIGGGFGWEHPYCTNCKYNVREFDIRDDSQQGLSLKAIEGHLGLPIVECSVPFDIDKPLTKTQLKEVVYYNKQDIDATEKILELRQDYIKTKVWLGEQKGLDEDKALYMTNAKLVATYLDATYQEHNDERAYKYPENILWQYIPQEVVDFFDRVGDKRIPDGELWGEKLSYFIGELAVVLGFGGIHAALPKYYYEKDDDYILQNVDVMGYYPHLAIYEGYVSRNIPSAKKYKDVVEKRDKAKKEGNKEIVAPLKLVSNETYGAMKQVNNPLYDPLQNRSTCITGQLRLLELTMHVVDNCEKSKIIQLNTDGLMCLVHKDDKETFDSICKEWMQRTKYTLEYDKEIIKLYQKDVNNYCAVYSDGKVKAKGGMLNRGISTAGAFNINNNYPIVAKAMIEYFVNGVLPKETIDKCDNVASFLPYTTTANKCKSVIECMRVKTKHKVHSTTNTKALEHYTKLLTCQIIAW